MFILKNIPYPQNALEPAISLQTLELHHGQHHQTYVDNLNKLVAGTDFAGRKLEDIIKASYGNSDLVAIYNNAGQVFNHDLYFSSLSPEKVSPSEFMLGKIKESFSSLEELEAKIVEFGLAQFASGWVWLVENEGKLEVIKTANADSPLVFGSKPLLVIDVWEHAYYLDYQNRRGDYLKEIVKQLDWRLAESRLKD